MLRIIGYHVADEIIANSDGEFCVEQPFIDFLLEPKPDCIKVFYHMGYSVANILKMLGVTEEKAKWLQKDAQLRTEPYFLKHRAGKFMSIKKGHYWGSPFANFSDMSQYKPVDLESIASKGKDGCFQAATSAAETGEQVYKALCSLNLHPTSLTSPINVYDKEILSKVDLPTIDDMPEEAGYYAYQCCQGNWLEAFQIGHWEHAWDYDINSAYPAELAKLLDIRLGRWEKSDKWCEEAEYGYCRGIADINVPFSPIIFSRENGGEDLDLNYTPTGTWERYLTKKKVEFLRRWGRGKFHLIDAWWWIPNERKEVYRTLIEQLWREKEKSEGIKREVVKRIMSGTWGKSLQALQDGFGELFCPPYGAEVESNVRLKVAEFVLDSGIDPIHISVDGVLSPIHIPIGESENKFGRWELTWQGACVCAGTAAVAMQGKRGTTDFSVDYDWLVEAVGKDPMASEYGMSKLSPVTLAVALNGNWEKLGELRTITKTVYVGEEVKRYYREKPQCGRDLLSRRYESEPWDASLLSNLVEQKPAISAQSE